ncbi:class I SAM-dependent DNA methyltransferase [Bradyrhizobium sp. SZCCHNPS2010]|uniref:class I SAM-dependent DNA methyltransferase n=1 Tax=Bradyrhizobium sp. SZCCHNPS2010 TaxID=3057333 RepID=UPI002916E218|nr:DNA methyltransferase [Bradyrhizobium sp. SZCCHNPS2010]
MTPHDFITKWQNSKLKERAAAQEHFIDLCRLLGEKTPAEIDSTGLDYGFEVGATKTTGGRGFADVFKRNHFGWEYKGSHANLDTAFAQLQRYAVALDNPPLLVVSDIGTTIRIHTNWTNSVSKTYEIAISELVDAEKRAWLKAAFSDPEALRPTKTRQQLTEEVAGDFADLARSLQSRGHDAQEVAHFVNKLVFCMFAEDVKLLPDRMFVRMLDRAVEDPAEFEDFARTLFAAMKVGGRVGFEKVAWFNGGLFNDDRVFALTNEEIEIVRSAARQYWGDVDPSILGTLFERGLDPEKRGQLGAHYTDRDKIMQIVRPVIVEPLAAEWEAAKLEIVGLIDKAQNLEAGAKTKGGRLASAAIGQATVARKEAQAVLDRYLKRISDYRILDPACGSGNFLYIALREMKDLEHRAQVEAEALGLPRRFPTIGPEVVKGIEINPYAAELARVSVWIGEIQWMLKNGFPAARNPVLKPLETIECRDALLEWRQEGGTKVAKRAQWPAADAIIGNPPFLGDRRMKPELGAEYVETLRSNYSTHVRGGADLVCFWIAKAWDYVVHAANVKVGLVTTNSIRSGANRETLKPIVEAGRIFDAWSDESWTVDGAAVRVSLICFDRSAGPVRLDGARVDKIHSDLTSNSSGLDITNARRLQENRNVAFQGVISYGPFQLEGTVARSMLLEPHNPNGRPNKDVVRPWSNGQDVARRPGDRWIIKFPSDCEEADASLYQTPFEFLRANVLPYRLKRSNDELKRYWWRLWRSRGDLFAAISSHHRYIATVRHSKHRLFRWFDAAVVPDSALIAIARSDDTTFGILHSKFHEIWSLRTGSWIGKGNDPRYTPTSTFETFPFPAGLAPNIPATEYASDPRSVAIATAAARLNSLRENWLNPPDLILRVSEVDTDFPDRLIPSTPAAAKALQKRTLTLLYNENPTWLKHAHEALDLAVASAYGWPIHLDDEQILARLFSLNQERAAGQPEENSILVDDEASDGEDDA